MPVDETKRPLHRAKAYDECNEEEQRAIKTFCDTADPSNLPEDVDNVWWTFTRSRRFGKLEAGYILGYLI